jgi:hypothetical protein
MGTIDKVLNELFDYANTLENDNYYAGFYDALSMIVNHLKYYEEKES